MSARHVSKILENILRELSKKQDEQRKAENDRPSADAVRGYCDAGTAFNREVMQ